MIRTFEKKSFPRMARDLKSMYEKDKISFSNAIQRTFVWKNKAKDNKMSLLIDSMLRGLPVPPMYANKNTETGVLDFLDGKQRSLTIIKFLNDEFELVGLQPFEDENGNLIDINGLKFSELPEEMRDTFRTYSLTVYYFEDMTEDEISEMFSRLNNGQVLKNIEKTRAEAKSFHTVKELGSHPVFDEMLSAASIASYGNEDIVIKTWIMLNNDKPSLDTKDVRPIMKDAEITTEQADQIKEIFDKIMEVHTEILNNETMEDKLKAKIAKRVYTKTHFISIVPLINRAIEEEKSNVEIAEWLCKFFCGGKSASIDEDYNICVGSGSGHYDSVNRRNAALVDSYENYFNGNDEEEAIEKGVEDVVEEATEE